MILTVNNITTTKEELEKLDRTDPYNVIGGYIQSITEFDSKNPDIFYEKLQVLEGTYQPLSAIMKQNIKDRMMQNDKYSYIGKSYFKGSTPENDYTPTEPYQIEITENPYTDAEEGYKKLFVQSGGADNPRGITLRLAKDGNYYIWSDSFMGTLADIRPLESTNPWV